MKELVRNKLIGVLWESYYDLKDEIEYNEKYIPKYIPEEREKLISELENSRQCLLILDSIIHNLYLDNVEFCVEE